MGNIITTSRMFSEKAIDILEKKYKAKYVCEISIKRKDGSWMTIPSAIFYSEEKHPKGSNYFAITHDLFQGGYIISDAYDSLNPPINAVMAKNGDVIYSRFNHDYRSSADGSVTIDGGREYLKITFNENITPNICKLGFDKDKLIILKDS